MIQMECYTIHFIFDESMIYVVQRGPHFVWVGSRMGCMSVFRLRFYALDKWGQPFAIPLFSG